MPLTLVGAMRRAAAILAAALLSLPGGPAAAQPGGAAPRFDILEFVVEGDTLLGAAAIERAVYPFLGEGRSAADAEGARRALEKAYQDAGFLSVTVTLPPQAVNGGEVRLVVAAAPVGRLRVTGAEYQLPSQVRAAVPSVAPGAVPNFNELQQELGQLAQARPDTQVTPFLAAGERPGTLDVELRQQDTLPLHGQIELNDKQTPGTERGRVEANLSWDNLFQRRHTVGLAWIVSPTEPRQTNIASLIYSLPVAPFGGTGDRLFAVFTRSDSDTPTAFGGLTVSRGQTTRLRWRDRLEAPAAFGVDHALSWGLTHRALKDRNQGVGGVDVESPSLRYTTLQAAYELNLSEGNAEAMVRSRLQAEVTLGVPGLTAREVDCFGDTRDQFACKRASASPRFQVLTLAFNQRRPLGRWSLELGLQGQVTDTPLVSAEQAVYGGVDSVRGYLEGEQAGDLGAAARVELVTPPWAPREGLAVRAHAFYDHAVLKRLYALPSEESQTQLASTGLGLRVQTAFGIEGTLHWARLLRNSRRADGAGVLQPLSGTAAGVRDRFDLAIRQVF
jgi:hemolysin activation/secretion protein